MIAIFKKELWNFFGNWSAWIIIAAFSIISALFLFFFENNFNIFEIGSATLQSFFVLSPWLFMFIIPAISMRTLAEEEQSGTLFWLFSRPEMVRSAWEADTAAHAQGGAKARISVAVESPVIAFENGVSEHTWRWRDRERG